MRLRVPGAGSGVMVASVAERGPLVRDVLLRDGWTLRLQTPTPEDFADIKAFYDALSPDSRYARLHGFGRTDGVARADAEADGVDRVALIGRHDGRVVAVASYDGLREPGVAEVAFAVADHDQRRGIGMRMLEQLAAIGADRGVRRFDAEVAVSNQLMMGVFEHVGFAVRRQGSFGEVLVSLDITPSEAVLERIEERDHFASIASLQPLLAPRSVAVVGASDAPGSVGGRVVQSIIASGFRGEVFAVNRSGGLVCSRRAARALADLPEPPQLAVIAVPAGEVTSVVDEAGRIGVRAVLVISAGFAETGDRGAELQRELVEIVRAHGMRLAGPNSLGVANLAPDVRLDATVGAAKAVPGGAAILSQSGALGLALLGLARARGLGVASFLAVGNRADVSTNDLLEYWQDDEAVAAIVLYVESFGNPQRFAQIAMRVSRRKPILVVKGRLAPRAGVEGPRSHVASALRSEDVFDALFHHSGVLRLDSTDALFDLAELLDRQPLPAGRHVGVVTNSGGLGTLAADASRSRGLSLPVLDPETQQKLWRVLPQATSVTNPVDLTVGAQPDDFATAVRELLRESIIDAVVVLFIALKDADAERVLDAVERTTAQAQKPVVAAILGPDGQPPRRAPGRAPNYRMPEAAVAALARAADRRAWLSRPLGQPARLPGLQVERAREVVLAARERDSDGWMQPAALSALLQAYGIALAPSVRCKHPRSAAVAAERFGGPIALKASLPSPGHAGDIDAVLIGLTGEDAIRAGWKEVRNRVRAAGHSWTNEVIVQPLIDPGADILVGSVNHPDLGPLVGLGLGGPRPAMTHAITFRLAPQTDTDVEDLIAASTGVSAWLEGFGGGPPLDRLALRDLLLRFSRLVTDTPELAEADLNAVRVLPTGYVVLDARLRLASPAQHARTRTW